MVRAAGGREGGGGGELEALIRIITSNDGWTSSAGNELLDAVHL